MSLLWTTAVDAKPFKIDHEMTHGGQPGYLITARVPGDHPSAEEYGTLAGYAHVEDRPDPDDPGGYKMHVHMIETNPAYKGQGVGRAILEEAVRRSDAGSVSHDGMTLEGAGLWKAVTGEHLHPTRWADKNNARSWRYA